MSETDKKGPEISDELNELMDMPESIILDSCEINKRIHERFKALMESHPENFKQFLEILINKFPIISYIYHMDSSNHSFAFIDLVKELINEKWVEIKTPFADIGCGPGNMMWMFLLEGLIPPGDVAMVDINKDYIDYARGLLVERGRRIPQTPLYLPCEFPGTNNFNFFNIKAEEFANKAAEKGLKFNTVYSSLFLQWIGEDLPPEEGKKVLKSACQSIFDSMNPGGKFIFIGEVPENKTATTLVSFTQTGFDEEKYDIGYNKGCLCEDVFYACIDAGFKMENKFAQRIMGEIETVEQFDIEKKYYVENMRRLISRTKSGDEVDSKEIKELDKIHLKLKTFHAAFATVFTKP
jgi:SAM-dependent methyltransferase